MLKAAQPDLLTDVLPSVPPTVSARESQVPHSVLSAAEASLPSPAAAADQDAPENARDIPNTSRTSRRVGGSLTLQAALQEFLASAVPRSKDPTRYRNQMRWLLSRHVLPRLGKQRLSSIRPPQVQALVDAMLADEYEVETANAVVRALSALFTWAIRSGRYRGQNPTSGLQRPAPPKEIEFLSEEESQALLAQARLQGAKSYALFVAALFTGLRKGELCGLRWGDIDTRRGILMVRRSYAASPKSGRPRSIPVHETLRDALHAWRKECPTQGDSELVFPVLGRMGSAHDMFGIYDLLQRAGVKPRQRPWHLLRHTFASHYVMSGGNLLLLQRILGHSRFEMTQIYSHLSVGFMASEIHRVAYGKPRC